MCFIKLRRRKRVGLVLGSGGARGLAHIGVIKTLLAHKIPIDLIVGSSSGALVGGYFALTGDVDALEKISNEITYKKMVEIMVDPTLGGGLIKGEKALNFLKEIFGEKKIEDFTIPFCAVATEVKTAERVVLNKGDAAEAIRASGSVPLFFSPFEQNGKILVDGGISCPVPVEVAKEMGAEVVIAVNLDGVYFLNNQNNKGIFGISSTMDVLKDSYFALRYNLAKKEVREADVVIEPEMSYIDDFDFVGGKKAIQAGIVATEKIMKKIKKLV